VSNVAYFVVPVAPVPSDGGESMPHTRQDATLAIGLLDNSKNNARQLLDLIAEGVRIHKPTATFSFAAKALASKAAPDAEIAKLKEADVVVTAMAD